MKKIWNKKVTKVVTAISLITIISTLVVFLNKAPSKALLVVDKSKVSSSWYNDYKYIFVCEDYNTTNCSILIDLEKLNPNEIENVIDFLKVSKEYICYDESYNYIESNHIVTDIAEQNRILRNKEQTSITFKQFVDGIANFNNLKYGDYITFDKPSATSRVQYNHKPNYQYIKGDASLSVPSINSIIKINDLEGKLEQCKLTFSYDVTSTNIKRIGLIVESNIPGNSFTKYYNYSTDPTKPNSSSTTPMFDFNFVH
jgi:hypothetical protein